MTDENSEPVDVDEEQSTADSVTDEALEQVAGGHAGGGHGGFSLSVLANKTLTYNLPPDRT